LQAFIRASDKTDWAANEEAVVVKCAVSETNDFFLVDKARMNEINSGYNREVSVTPLIFQPCRFTYTYVFCDHHTRYCLRRVDAPSTKRFGQLYNGFIRVSFHSVDTLHLH
jgi:hypothetical protein